MRKIPPLKQFKNNNNILKSLTNKLHCKIGPQRKIESWKYICHPNLKHLLTDLSEDINFVKSYILNYSRFIDPGMTGYVRMKIFYTEATNIAEIQVVVAQFKKPIKSFFEISYSNLISHVYICTLTGSMKSLVDFRDFQTAFKKIFKLLDLGL